MGLLARLLGGRSTERDLIAELIDDYRAEATQAIHLRQHADLARYPQVASRLRALADLEERHAGLLREHILGLGGGIPPVSPPPLAGHNQWERAVVARKAAQEKRRRLIEHATHWDPEEPELATLLRQIADEDQREFRVYEAVIMRSDPQAID